MQYLALMHPTDQKIGPTLTLLSFVTKTNISESAQSSSSSSSSSPPPPPTANTDYTVKTVHRINQHPSLTFTNSTTQRLSPHDPPLTTPPPSSIFTRAYV
ncbi:uncharacterized protein MEPE_05553 [Melanopsichium pennsylvanicum]|uniref:Uncharacterized protein n=1 Tax=Melanopsichium pennsylvanicum TaxID=63383 RepID=A0AAJ4XPP2_9BASI|nr:uncharacterized protein MEPE_05553 [Melanopsichium pennsylvanicum]